MTYEQSFRRCLKAKCLRLNEQRKGSRLPHNGERRRRLMGREDQSTSGRRGDRIFFCGEHFFGAGIKNSRAPQIGGWCSVFQQIYSGNSVEISKLMRRKASYFCVTARKTQATRSFPSPILPSVRGENTLSKNTLSKKIPSQ